MNIGVLSGSFNPIHVGHLILANYLVEFTELDEIWFLVSPQNPLKDQNSLLNECVRFEMVELALKNYSKLKVSGFEFNLPRPTYSISTLNSLKANYPHHNFSLIIGSDNWKLFHKWKDYQQILDNYKLYVYPRILYPVNDSISSKSVNFISAPIIEISSTFLRHSISEGKDVRSFFPPLVYDFIIDNNLYQSEN